MSMDDLALARQVAVKSHEGQMYGKHPYVYHLQAVEAAAKSFYPMDERLRILSYLHDILEDTKMTVETLQALFEKDIVNAVVAITKLEHETREEYLVKVKANQLARKVKLADAFCNLEESLKRGDMKRVKKYGETLAFLAS